MEFRWNLWNLDHIEAHGVHPDEAENIVRAVTRPYPENIGQGKWMVRGQTMSGRYLQVIYVEDEDGTIYVIHARPPYGQRETTLATEKKMSAAFKKKSAIQAFLDLTDEEKAEVVKKYDEEFSGDKYFREATPEECARWEQTRRRLKLSNPTRAYRSVKTTLPLNVVKDLDRLARQRKVSRSKMIAMALAVYLARERERGD